MSRQRYVIIGGGVAAASAAATLRSHDFDGDIVIVSDDHALPYERPPLSKHFLTPTSDGSPTLVKPADWYDEHGISVMLGVRARTVDPVRKTVELSTGDVLPYSRLLLATGGRSRSLPNIDGDRVLMLRSLADAQQLRDRLVGVHEVAVLGGGFIGCEAASTAIRMGKRVTVIERTGNLMEAALGPVLGDVLTDVHRASGVHVMTGTVVQAVEDAGSWAVVRTACGVVEADLVLVGAGSVPNVELAIDSGIDVQGGVLTDEFSLTSVPDVFAAGDVAATFHPFYGRHLRVEHHDTAMHHGSSAAKNMLGISDPFCEPHWFWSDQYDHSLQQVGRAESGDQLVIRGSLDELTFSAFSLRAGRITRVISLNRPKDVLAARRLLFTEHQATTEQLQDESLPLNRLAPRKRPVRVEES